MLYVIASFDVLLIIGAGAEVGGWKNNGANSCIQWCYEWTRQENHASFEAATENVEDHDCQILIFESRSQDLMHASSHCKFGEDLEWESECMS